MEDIERLLDIANIAVRGFIEEVGIERPITAEEVIESLTTVLKDAEAGNIYVHPDQLVAYAFTITVLRMLEDERKLAERG